MGTKGTKSAKKKMTKKKWIIVAAVVAAGVLLAVFLLPQFLFRANMQSEAGTTRTASVEKGTIETTVVGSGNLAAGDTLQIKLPSDVTVDTVLVDAGDTVAAGDTLATLNAASLQSAIANAEEELSSLDSKIDETKDNTESNTITSAVSGRVKQIFAGEGDSTSNIIDENGSLAVVSIDGKMKVTFTPSSTDGLGIGSEVDVTLSDGDTETGTVSTLSAKSCTVTLTDNGPTCGDDVIISLDGTELGTGTLEINAPIAILGGTGTIESVDVSLNESISSGDTLFTLTEAAVSREYETLLTERTEYEEILRILLKYAETNSITAESGGTISEVSITAAGDSSASTSTGSDAQSSSSAARGVSSLSGNTDDFVQLLSASSGDSENITLLTESDTVTELTGVTEIFVNNPATGNTPQSTIMPGNGYTGTISWEPADLKFEADTVYAANITLTAALGYHFSSDATVNVAGAKIENITVSPETSGNVLAFRAVFEATAQDTQQDQQAASAESNAQGDNSAAASGGMPSGSSGSTSYSASNASGSAAASTASSSGSASSDSEDSLLQTAFTIQTGEANCLTVNVDELDILTIDIGQEATIVLDALPEDSFHGTVTKISNSGTVQSGVTTYPVTITLDDISGSGALTGMNATATISIATSTDVLLIPLDALQEMGNEQFVYIVGDSDEGLGERRIVETGLSDGTNVEIISGLSEGEQVAYIESTSAGDSEQTMMQGMGGGTPPNGGNMGGGTPPDGGGMGGGPMG